MTVVDTRLQTAQAVVTEIASRRALALDSAAVSFCPSSWPRPGAFVVDGGLTAL